jgi:RNA polymerase sigma factor (TIGR02999 family)
VMYEELRRLARGHMAQEHGLQTLTATALVHEAWLQLGSGVQWQSRRHFFGAAAEAMRRILIARAREKQAVKRGAGAQRVPLEDLEIMAESPDEELLAVHEALDKLRAEDALAAEIVMLRYFAGLTWPELAEVLETGERDLRRQWQFARDWLHAEISGRLD